MSDLDEYDDDDQNSGDPNIKKSVTWVTTDWNKEGYTEEGIICKYQNLVPTYCTHVILVRDTYAPKREAKGLSPLHYHSYLRCVKQTCKSVLIKVPGFEKVWFGGKKADKIPDRAGAAYVLGLTANKMHLKTTLWTNMDIKRYMEDDPPENAVRSDKKRTSEEAGLEVLEMMRSEKTLKQINEVHPYYLYWNFNKIRTYMRFLHVINHTGDDNPIFDNHI